jgi:hypothetical protein
MPTTVRLYKLDDVEQKDSVDLHEIDVLIREELFPGVEYREDEFFCGWYDSIIWRLAFMTSFEEVRDHIDEKYVYLRRICDWLGENYKFSACHSMK